MSTPSDCAAFSSLRAQRVALQESKGKEALATACDGGWRPWRELLGSSFPLRCGAQSSRRRNSNAIENLVCGAEQQRVEISEGRPRPAALEAHEIAGLPELRLSRRSGFRPASLRGRVRAP